MATPSYYKSIPIALLVVFATVASNLQQSAAAVRADDGAEKAPAPRGPPIQPKGGMFSDFPCFPFLPKVLRDLCHDLFNPSPSPPTPQQSCRSMLKERLVSPCTGFLTNSSVQKPPPACCSNIMSFYLTPSLYCFCHVANGNIGQLLPAPLNRSRAIPVLSECIGYDGDMITHMCIDRPDIYHVPPMDSTAPPPAPETKKA